MKRLKEFDSAGFESKQDVITPEKIQTQQSLDHEFAGQVVTGHPEPGNLLSKTMKLPKRDQGRRDTSGRRGQVGMGSAVLEVVAQLQNKSRRNHRRTGARIEAQSDQTAHPRTIEPRMDRDDSKAQIERKTGERGVKGQRLFPEGAYRRCTWSTVPGQYFWRRLYPVRSARGNAPKDVRSMEAFGPRPLDPRRSTAIVSCSACEFSQWILISYTAPPLFWNTPGPIITRGFARKRGWAFLNANGQDVGTMVVTP